MRALLDSTQILINVHTTAHHHTLEEYRVLPALLRGCVVVSEDVPLAREVPYADSIVFAPYERLLAISQDSYQTQRLRGLQKRATQP